MTDINIYRGLDEVPAGFGPSAVTIGVFDGIHRGHQALMRTVVQQARAHDARSVVVTFDRHPLEVIAPGREPAMLTTLPQRARLMEALGIDALIVLPFDEGLRLMPAEDFVRDVLVEMLGCVHVVVGANFRFGHNQAGTIETLTDLGHAYGFDTTIFALQMGGEEQVVSSSLIRRHIAEGLVERVAEELDRPFRIEGVVEHGAGRGKGLGVPTANLRTDPRLLLPKLGVYAGWLWWKGRRYPAVTNVGVNPTFGDRTTPVVETHVMEFDQDLYGEVVELEFTHRLRDERRFAGIEELKAQMRADIAEAAGLLGAGPTSSRNS